MINKIHLDTKIKIAVIEGEAKHRIETYFKIVAKTFANFVKYFGLKFQNKKHNSKVVSKFILWKSV